MNTSAEDVLECLFTELGLPQWVAVQVGRIDSELAWTTIVVDDFTISWIDRTC